MPGRPAPVETTRRLGDMEPCEPRAGTVHCTNRRFTMRRRIMGADMDVFALD
jgi:hypothetical protein